jgi:hypothetical protein
MFYLPSNLTLSKTHMLLISQMTWLKPMIYIVNSCYKLNQNDKV